MKHIIEDMNHLSKNQLQYLRGQRIVLGTPFGSGMGMGNYILSVSAAMRWAGIHNIPLNTEFLFGATYLHFGRNYIANELMKTNFTHLVFIDADCGFHPKHLFELILTEKDIVGGLYPRRKTNWKAVHQAVLAGVPPEGLAHCSGDFPMHPLAGHDIEFGQEPQKVLTMPTGFLCITRKAFEAYAEAHPEKMTTPGNPGYIGMEYFIAGVFENDGSRGWDTEDNQFCKDLNKLGFPTYFCPWMSISHFGTELHEACVLCSNGIYVHFPEIQERLKEGMK